MEQYCYIKRLNSKEMKVTVVVHVASLLQRPPGNGESIFVLAISFFPCLGTLFLASCHYPDAFSNPFKNLTEVQHDGQ
jgi:hypothetical protein